MSNLEKLQELLGYKFKDEKLLLKALTHKSTKLAYNNERLEFLGDAVMDLIVADYLFDKFKNTPEGELSKLRSALVNEKSFANIAKYLLIGENLKISIAEENNNGRKKDSLLSNAFEAIIGAIYLESGLEVSKFISIKLIEKIYPKINLETIGKDYKTTLQEITQARFGQIPDYKLLSSSGPDHMKEFEIAVFINNSEFARAKGKSKKQAEQSAASIAIKALKA